MNDKMRRAALSSVLAAACLCPSAWGAPDLEQAIGLAQGYVRQTSERRSATAVTLRREFHESFVDIDACWTRDDDAAADALGLPKQFCLRRFGVSIPRPYQLPFTDDSAAVVAGDPVSGRLHVSGGARETWGWNIVGDLWKRDAPAACGRLNMAFAAVYFDIDRAGNTLPNAPEIRGFLMDGSALCPSPAKARDFLYKRTR